MQNTCSVQVNTLKVIFVIVVVETYLYFALCAAPFLPENKINFNLLVDFRKKKRVLT